LVDTDALTHALQTGSIAGAAIDTTDPEPLPSEHPLWDMGNVQITPHMAGHTPKHWPRLAEVLADSVKLLDAGREWNSMTNLVETP
jgi:phosphoglycerate dehydrogenase-like enzyme